MTMVERAPISRVLRGDRAGFDTRMAASIIDGIVVILLHIAIIGTIAMARFMVRPRLGVRLPTLEAWQTVLLFGLLAVGVFSVSWATTGRSPGDILLGLRVVRNSGAKLGIVRAIVRAVTCVVFPAGLVLAVFDRRNRSLQDIIVDTTVLYDWGLGSHVPGGA